MYFLSTTESNRKLKKVLYWLLIPRGQARPKSLVEFLFNQYFHKKGKKAAIRVNTVSKSLIINFKPVTAKKCNAIQK